jgi:hypothetical protein
MAICLTPGPLCSSHGISTSQCGQPRYAAELTDASNQLTTGDLTLGSLGTEHALHNTGAYPQRLADLQHSEAVRAKGADAFLDLA